MPKWPPTTVRDFPGAREAWDKAKVEAGGADRRAMDPGPACAIDFFGLEESTRRSGTPAASQRGSTVRRFGVTRRQLFEVLDRPPLKSLSARPYEFSNGKYAAVGIDYHVEVAAHYYSVPYRYARAEVEARLTVRTVEIFLKGERIAAHLRAGGNHKHTTIPEHMPSSHRRYAGVDDRAHPRRRSADRASDVGALRVDPRNLRPHPEQGFRACLGIVRLPRGLTAPRAWRRRPNVRSISAAGPGVASNPFSTTTSIGAPRPDAGEAKPIQHSNIRGPRYYH